MDSTHHLHGYHGETILSSTGIAIKHGYGVMRFSTGAVYRGKWKENKMHGRGMYDWGDGNIYLGDFADGKQHGQGIYKWPTGGQFSGGWNQDRMHGYGVYTRSDGVRYVGCWKDDVQFDYGRKIVPVRICWSSDCITTVERVYQEKWGEGKVLLMQMEILVHPGSKMWETLTDKEAFCDVVVRTSFEDGEDLQDKCSSEKLLQLEWLPEKFAEKRLEKHQSSEVETSRE
mmetsp:Transcript_2234/g.8249  ORF Transcript_2234/g.8249 Transcript_2234/m.8249 type:complete len:229 (-) Transcript_2234:321-1007(-)